MDNEQIAHDLSPHCVNGVSQQTQLILKRKTFASVVPFRIEEVEFLTEF